MSVREEWKKKNSRDLKETYGIHTGINSLIVQTPRSISLNALTKRHLKKYKQSFKKKYKAEFLKKERQISRCQTRNSYL